MNESERKRELVKGVKALGGYARRLEDRWAVGLLDLVIKLPDQPVVFAEGKLVHGNLFAPTAAQHREGELIIKAGGLAVLIGWEGRTMYISPWTKKADKRDCWMSAEGKFAEFLLKYVSAPNAKEKESQSA